jgi:hypothetical protein
VRCRELSRGSIDDFQPRRPVRLGFLEQLVEAADRLQSRRAVRLRGLEPTAERGDLTVPLLAKEPFMLDPGALPLDEIREQGAFEGESSFGGVEGLHEPRDPALRVRLRTLHDGVRGHDLVEERAGT